MEVLQPGLYLCKGSVVSRQGGNAQLCKRCNNHICIKNTASGKDTITHGKLLNELRNHNSNHSFPWFCDFMKKLAIYLTTKCWPKTKQFIVRIKTSKSWTKRLNILHLQSWSKLVHVMCITHCVKTNVLRNSPLQQEYSFGLFLLIIDDSFLMQLKSR